jgi:hypothetical protein
LAFDIQIVAPQEAVPISQIIPVEGETPSVLLVGQDFSAVDEVFINDILAPTYQVVDFNRILAVLPAPLSPIDVQTAQVLSKRLVMTEKSLLRFRLGRVPSKVNGILRLVQVFIRILLANPGSSIFNPELGGGVLRTVGKTFGRQEAGSMVADFIVAVDNVKRQVISLQARQGSLPASERLLDARVVESRFDVQLSALIVKIEILSQAGTTGLANLVV